MKYVVALVCGLVGINSFAMQHIPTILLLRGIGHMTLGTRPVDSSRQHVSNEPRSGTIVECSINNTNTVVFNPIHQPLNRKILKQMQKHVQKNCEPKNQKRNHSQPSNLHKQPSR